MRITENMRIAQTAHALRTNGSEVFDLTGVATTGRQIDKPSDGPAAYASIVGRADRIKRLDARMDAVARADEDLQTAETALAGAADLLLRAREIAVGMADGEFASGERAAAAKEVGLLRQAMVAYANTKGTRGFVFAGTNTGTAPFDSAGQFFGNDAEMNVEYADQQLTAVNVSGQTAFTALSGGRDLLQDLSDLEAALVADDPAAIHALITPIADGHEQLVDVRAEAGLRMGRLRSAMDVTENTLIMVKNHQAATREGDTTEIFSQLSNAQLSYERSLAITRQVLSMATALERF